VATLSAEGRVKDAHQSDKKRGGSRAVSAFRRSLFWWDVTCRFVLVLNLDAAGFGQSRVRTPRPAETPTWVSRAVFGRLPKPNQNITKNEEGEIK
jgi:hypothetical protein